MDQVAIREIAERNVRLLAAKPDRGHLSCATRARLADGLRCEIEEGPWRLAADMPAKVGGDESAPTPGVLGRGALAGCLTIGIAAWAARLGVPLEASRSRSRPTSTPAASSVWATCRPATGGPLHRLDRRARRRATSSTGCSRMAERHSPYLDVFGRAIALKRALRVNGKEA